MFLIARPIVRHVDCVYIVICLAALAPSVDGVCVLLFCLYEKCFIVVCFIVLLTLS